MQARVRYLFCMRARRLREPARRKTPAKASLNPPAGGGGVTPTREVIRIGSEEDRRKKKEEQYDSE